MRESKSRSSVAKTVVYIAMSMVLVMLTGCSTNLVVSEPNGVALGIDKGIPFRLPKPYLATAKYTKLKSGKDCKPIAFTKFVSLPTGDLYHVNTRPQIFAKSEFTIELNDHGILKKIVFNADPGINETIESTAGLVTAISGLGDESAAAAAEAGEIKPGDLTDPKALNVKLEAVQKLLKGSEAVQELSEEALEALRQFLEKAKAKQLKPSCDTGERITCIQPLKVGEKLEKCEQP